MKDGRTERHGLIDSSDHSEYSYLMSSEMSSKVRCIKHSEVTVSLIGVDKVIYYNERNSYAITGYPLSYVPVYSNLLLNDAH